MSFTLILLLFASSFCWSVFDLCRKKATQSLSVFFTLFVFMLIQAALFALWALITRDTEFLSSYWMIGLAGLAANFTANSLFIYSVSISSFSESVPMLSFAPVFSVVVSFFLLDEVLTALQLSGIVLIVAGALLLNGMPSFDLHKRGPLMMILAAFFWAVMGVVDKLCLRHASIPMHSLFQTLGISSLAAIAIFMNSQAKFQFSKLKSQLRIFSVGSMAALGAIGCQLYVVRLAPVGMVEGAKRALTLLFTLIFAKVFFAESINSKKLLAVTVMAAGLFLLLG